MKHLGERSKPLHAVSDEVAPPLFMRRQKVEILFSDSTSCLNKPHPTLIRVLPLKGVELTSQSCINNHRSIQIEVDILCPEYPWIFIGISDPRMTFALRNPNYFRVSHYTLSGCTKANPIKSGTIKKPDVISKAHRTPIDLRAHDIYQKPRQTPGELLGDLPNPVKHDYTHPQNSSGILLCSLESIPLP